MCATQRETPLVRPVGPRTLCGPTGTRFLLEPWRTGTPPPPRDLQHPLHLNPRTQTLLFWNGQGGTTESFIHMEHNPGRLYLATQVIDGGSILYEYTRFSNQGREYRGILTCYAGKRSIYGIKRTFVPVTPPTLTQQVDVCV